MTRKVIVLIDLDNPSKKINDILFPKITDNILSFCGIKSSKKYTYGIVILSSQRDENDLFKMIVDNGHEIESVEVLLDNLNRYINELPKYKIGNILKLEENKRSLKFVIVHKKLRIYQ